MGHCSDLWTPSSDSGAIVVNVLMHASMSAHIVNKLRLPTQRASPSATSEIRRDHTIGQDDVEGVSLRRTHSVCEHLLRPGVRITEEEIALGTDKR
jgi:hypothetical protein